MINFQFLHPKVRCIGPVDSVENVDKKVSLSVPMESKQCEEKVHKWGLSGL